MVDFSRGYVPPGVYVDDTSAPIVVPSGVPTATVCLVGPALGYEQSTEAFPLYSQTATFLLSRGVFVTDPSIEEPTVMKTDGTPLVEGADYALTVDNSEGGGTANARVSIRRLANSGDTTAPGVVSPNGLADGETVVIIYRYADPGYYTPQVFEDYDLLAARYGDALVTEPTSSGNQVVSPLSLAAKLAFENGASSVICLPTESAAGTLRAQFQAAYRKLESDHRVTMIVPVIAGVNEGNVTTGTPALANFLTDLKVHCEGAASDGYGRIGLVGAPKQYEEDADFAALAEAVKSKRVVLLYPGRVSIYNSSINRITEVDGVYVAAAAAGMLASGPINRGLTKKSLNGFAGVPSSVFQKMTRSYKDNLSKSGVSVVEVVRDLSLVVRHGVSTDISAVNTREISLTRIADTLFQIVQSGLDNSGLIGEPIDANMTTQVKGALTGLLEQSVSTEVIVGYANLQVRQQVLPNGDPTVVECKFDYRPALPLNYITVAFSINLDTGELLSSNEQVGVPAPPAGP